MKTKSLHFALIAFSYLSFQLLTHNCQAQATFSPASTFSTGIFPYSVISLDLNGDGKTDLALANNTSNNVSILFGDGAGSFAAATNFTVGTNPRSVISADFNNDGKPDLAVSHDGSSYVSILLGDGTGGFSSAINSVSNNLNSIISADFNGDGKADLAGANNGVFVLLGDGTGNFGAATNFPVNAFSISVISSDFNGDGKADLATANQNLNNVSVFLGNGLGSFGTASNFAVGNTPSSITCSDFNGDGKSDLATANQGSNKVSVLLGNGAGSFSAPANFPVGGAPFSVTSSDFNADGKEDLAVTNFNDNNVSVLLGNGLGGFGTAANFAVGSGPMSVISGDFNGDNNADLAVADLHDADVSVLLNTTIDPAPPICLVTVDSTQTHNLIVWEKTNLDMTTIDSFIVYREITTNNYQRIGAVQKNSLSNFDDFTANPASTGYRYKLKSKKTSGIVSLLSNYHNSIYLTNTNANFSWTPYQIENNTTPVSSYNVYRDDNSTGDFHNIGNTTGNQFGFTDVNFASYPNSQYYVEAVMTSGTCNPTRTGYNASLSNLKHFGTSGVQQFSNNIEIHIYPNPADNMLNVTGIKEKITIRMFDVVGKLVIEKEVENNTTINTSLLTAGVYTLLTESKTGRTFNKVVLSR